MRLLIGTLIVVISLAISASTATAQTMSYTCTYKPKNVQVYLTIYGPENIPALCRMFGKSMTRWSGYIPGQTVCLWRMTGFGVYVRVRAANKMAGNFLCNYLEGSLNPDDWTRLK